jgi:hypothetical protein
MTITIVGGGNPSGPTFPVQRSVRLRSSATAYFNRTLASSGTTATFSAWVKRGAFGSASTIFGTTDGSTYDFQLTFTASNTLEFYSFRASAVQLNLNTTQVFRDPSAWYHIVLVLNTTQATASSRVQIFVNGVQVTALSTATYPAQNAVTPLADSRTFGIGNRGNANNNYFDGYLTEVNFIDGQALTPSSFGSYNSYGVWSPAKYTGTYGTNGFYLNFQDNSAATATTIGKDSSGNGNNWTPNNISVTAGVTYDSMLDVPTLTSNTNANFATFNPLLVWNTNGSNFTISGGNLNVSEPAATTYGSVASTIAMSSGKWYCEITATAVGAAQFTYVGITETTSAAGFPGQTATSYSYSANGNKLNNNSASAYGATYAANDIIGIAFDADARTLTFYKNGTSQGTAYSSIPSGSYYFVVGDFATTQSSAFSGNFGQRPFSYTPPSGFNRLCTYNLPTPAIPNGAAQMAATTYTGNGSSQTVVNTVNGTSMQPDFLWIKGRSGATDHQLLDTVRGANGVLVSNSTAAETVYGAGQVVFNSNGFIVGGLGTMNTNAATYVGWQWKANGTPAVVNTSGSIPSTISANTTAGFSIVTYTGTGANATVGHGLGIAPKMVIAKSRGTAGTNWGVWHTSLTSYSYYLLLNSTAAQTTAATTLQALPTSTVVSLGSSSIFNDASTMVMYCFSEIAGYSKFGSYTGNGSADGPFVYLGFRPRFILRKRIDTTSDWLVQDSSRPGYNATTTYTSVLYADTSGAETIYNEVDILSNGFKIRASDAFGNASGGTYIYAAFAENPFNYSLAR